MFPSYNRRGSRRGVSPVIATVLIIALVTAAAATVWIITSSFLDNDPQFVLTADATYDYNNDGRVDLLVVNVYNPNTEKFNLTYTTLENWNIYNPGEIAAASERKIILYTSIGFSQLEADTTVNVGIGPSETVFSIKGLNLPKAQLVDPLTVIYTSQGDAIPGALVTFKHFDGTPVSFPPTPTDGAGEVEADLLPGYYYAYTSTGHESSLFNNIQLYFSEVNVQISGGDTESVTIQVLDSDGSPLQGFVVYNTDTDLNDLGVSEVTNATGYAQFTLLNGSYLFRTNYLSQNFFSSQVDLPGQISVYTIQIKSGSLGGKITFGGEVPGARYYLYSYTSTGTYLNKRVRTDNQGNFNFTSGVTSGVFKIRLYANGRNLYSDLISSSTSDLVVDFGGGILNILVKLGDDVLPNRQRTRLYHADGGYIGTDRVNSTGIAEYGVQPGFEYKLRVDYLGQYIYSQIFTHNSSLTTVEFAGGNLDILVKAGNVSLPKRVNIRLFTSSGSYTGRSDRTNASGFAELGVVIGAEYKIRVDWLGQYFYSDAFNHTDSTPKVIDLAGGPLNILITAGGNPLPKNVYIRLFTASGSYTGISDRTNASGWAEFPNVIGADYKIRVDWLGKYTYSSSFPHENSTAKTIDVGGGALVAHLNAGGSDFPANVYVRLFAGTSYTGISTRTNSSGHANFGIILAGTYRLRVDWLSQYLYTNNFENNGTVVEIDMAGGEMTPLILAGGEPLRANVYVRLFTASGRYTGKSARTNSSGHANFGVIPSGNDYKLRLDWLALNTYTGNFEHNNSKSAVLDVGGGSMSIKVTSGGENIPNNVYVRLFTNYSSYTGLSARVNETGYVNFGVILSATFMLRYDWLGSRTLTNTIVHDGSVQTIDDSTGGTFWAYLTENFLAVTQNTRVYLYTASGSYTGLNVRVNSTGHVNFGVILSGDYKLRVDLASGTQYTTVFTHAVVSQPYTYNFL